MQISEIQHKNIPDADKADIIELGARIEAFKTGKEDEERFKLYRLTRGVYGQRQLGVQMFRLKIPYGKITSDQLAGVADISDQFATGNLHLTTRQNIQLHYVKLDDSPEVWVRLAELGMTAREACGNTVRNITASPTAGIDPEESFDVTPYVHAVFEYFLRNPICQEMGRKIKPAFSASPKDTAYTYFSDFGFIPKIKEGQRGFELVVGGGLGALAMAAEKIFDFIPTDEIIPFMEAALRVFDRYGEREKRQKARMKFLVGSLGVEKFMELVFNELKSLENQHIPIDIKEEKPDIPAYFVPVVINIENDENYSRWLYTNVFTQKQENYRGVFLKVTLGDLSSEKARALAKIVKKYAADDLRITINQNLLLRFVHPDHLPELYQALQQIGLVDAGVNGIGDITACPGTDTCNLGVTNSTGLTLELERHLKANYASEMDGLGLDIKLSGCMNSCGQHMAAGIGFHGSSIKNEGKIIPAMQVVVGGGLDSQGVGHMAQKVIKIPTKRVPIAVSIIIEDYKSNAVENEEFIHYAQKQGRRYYYDVLKDLGNLEDMEDEIYMDWGQDHMYNQAIGVGECAGVIMDVVGTILQDAEQKLSLSKLSITNKAYKDAVYHAYSAYVTSAKAILLSEDIKCNTQIKILDDFQTEIIDSGKIKRDGNFTEEVLRLKEHTPDEEFTKNYLLDAETFYGEVMNYRFAHLELNKKVIESYYKA